MPMTMEPKINFITLAVKNLVNAKAFYENAFGFLSTQTNDELCVFALHDNLYLALQKVQDFVQQTNSPVLGTASAGFILSHNVNSAKDVDRIIEKAEKYGAMRIKTLEEQWGYSIVIADLDGHHWEIVYTVQ